MSTCIIKELLSKPFPTRSFSEKREIIKNGRPTPELPNLVQKTNKFNRHFQPTVYRKCEWLAGSTEFNSLFCWFCLLFGKDRNSSWTKTGFKHLGNLVKSIAEHGMTVNHLRSSVNIAAFGGTRRETALDDHLKKEISQHNKKVKRNRDILKRLVNAVCFLGKQGLACQDYSKRENCINQSNYEALIKYTAEYDSLLEEHLDTSTVFRGLSNRIQNDLIKAIGSTLLSAIKQEIKEVPFVSVIVDETTDVTNKAQFSIVLRYVYDGEIQERFLGFCDIGNDRHAQAVAELILHFISEFECNEKLIAQSYDGAATMTVQTLIKATHPQALSVHCYAHVLNHVLSQSTSHIPECKVFFSTLNGLTAFFSRSPKRAKFLDEFLQRHLPNVSPTQWNYSSRLVNTVCNNRNQLCDIFCTMLQHPDEIESDILSPIQGFLSVLEDFKFVFLLNTFNKIFAVTEVLHNILQNQESNILYCQEKIQEIRHTIVALRNDDEEVYQKTISQVGEPSKRRNFNYKHTYYEVFDNIDSQLDSRFQDYSRMQFLDLISHEKYGQYSKDFPESHFQSLLGSYGKFFDSIRLKNELIVLYSSEEFEHKNICELAKLLNTKSALKTSFQQLTLLVSLLYTIPVSTSSVEISCSALKRIKNYSQNFTGEERLTYPGIISIEARLLEGLRKKEQFLEAVVAKFAYQEREMEFNFR